MRSLHLAWSRIARMGWAERRTRATQEISKRVDLALYRCGLLSAIKVNPAQSGGKFFFSRVELGQRTAILRVEMAGDVERMIQEADEVCRHHFRLLGYDPLDYGAEIDWHLDAVHGVRAPMKPWFKIKFLDFAEVGDHKVIWELNRHQHLVILAKAWALTGDARYVVELQAQWYSWWSANPYPMGVNWGSSLEVAFRSLSWIWSLSLLPNTGPDADFRRDVLRGLARNGKYIEAYLSTYFSPNTHLIGECAALFFIGTACPEIPGARRWREKGWRILLEEARRQVRPDGVYFEQSLYYHVYALDFFLHARILAARNGIEVAADLDAVLKKMLDVLAVVSQAGMAEGFGDDDGGRVFNPRRNRSLYLTDSLALGAILFQGQDLISGAKLTEEAIWLFGGDAVTTFSKPAPPRKVETAGFAAGGVYVMAGGDSAMQMVIDAGPQGTGRSGHGHADALSVSLTMDGRRWLVDSGTSSYVGGERDQFRGTAAHNTLRVDGLDQAVPDGPFGWKSIPKVQCERWISTPSFAFFSGSHTGYMRLADPVTHRRQIFHLVGEFWLVRDLAEGREEHEIEINWHFASDIKLERMANAVVAISDNIPEDSGGHSLTLLPLPEAGWEDRTEGGLVSPAYGRQEAAVMVRSSARVRLPVDHATLLAPFAAGQEIGTFSRQSGSTESLSAYSYKHSGKRHFMIFASLESGIWTWNEWSSDARFLYFCVEGERISRLIFCDGSALRVDGKPIVVHHCAIERFEWDTDTAQSVSSDGTARNSFSREALESCTAASVAGPDQD